LRAQAALASQTEGRIQISGYFRTRAWRVELKEDIQQAEISVILRTLFLYLCGLISALPSQFFLGKAYFIKYLQKGGLLRFK
jgi:hypothetical protein